MCSSCSTFLFIQIRSVFPDTFTKIYAYEFIPRPFLLKILRDKFSDFSGTEKQKRWGDPPHAYAYASVRSSIAKFFLELNTTVCHL